MNSKDFTYDYKNRKVSYKVWFTDDSENLGTIIFLGTVQIDKLPQWVAEQCPSGTAVVQGAPHWFADDDGRDIVEYLLQYTKNAFDSATMNRKFDKLHIIADSQAASSVVRLFAHENEYLSHLKDLTLIQPSGFTANIFDGDNEQRIETFKKRVICNTYDQLPEFLIDDRLRYNYKTLVKMTSFRDPKSRLQYGNGLAHNALPNLWELSRLNDKITIICGEKDKLFTAQEIKSNLQSANIPVKVVVVEGVAHSSLATKKGRLLLHSAFKIVK